MHRLVIPALLAARFVHPQDAALRLETFETVWRTVQQKHFDPSQLEDAKSGLSWNRLHDEFRTKVEKSASMDETRSLIREMISRLGLSHFQIIGKEVYTDLDATPGGEGRHGGDGRAGIDVAVIDGRAYVAAIENESPAALKGIKPGWRIVKIRDRAVDTVLARIAADKSHPVRIPSTQHGFLLSRLSGMVGEELLIEFEDGTGQPRTVSVRCAPSRGALTKFGFLPPMPVWIDFQKKQVVPNQTVGIFKFNLFLDPPRLMDEVQKAVSACALCQGFVIDLRGNPGGIGALAMGLGGFFVQQQDLKLGQMLRRDMTLNFILNPRTPTFKGPVAILMDGSSGSTSEIFAGGMQDIKRARIFGSRSMGAALPSVIEKLPNGDGFQYAVANYVSQGGATLEGRGVIPDQEVVLTRESLLSGRDPVLAAAVEWINAQKIPARQSTAGAAAGRPTRRTP